MKSGRLIAVVGPSGVGKDSVMSGITTALPQVKLIRRVITRAPELGGEDYTAASQEDFDAMRTKGAFAVDWQAHGLCYGIPASVYTLLETGSDCLVNFSRSALSEAAALFPDFIVLNITATPETLAHRLVGRGRESKAEIANRLAQANKSIPSELDIIHISNDGALDETVAKAVSILRDQGRTNRATSTLKSEAVQ